MQTIFYSTLPIFLVTLLGSVIKRKWLTSNEFWRGLEKLSYFILFPAMLFNYISVADLGSKALIKLVIGLMAATAIVAGGLIMHRARLETDGIQFTSIFQGAIRYNSYIFFGLADALFGEEGLGLVAVISSYMIIFTNFLSVMVFAKYIPPQRADEEQHNILALTKIVCSNPLIVASLAGFAFNYANLELNLGIKKTLSCLSESALAIGMLNVGAGLRFIIDSHHFKQIIYASLVKLVILPLVTVIVLSIMSISGTERAIGILYSCLPCASTAFVLSRQLGGDPESMASIITFGTIFSVVSLSLIMYILT